MRVDARSRSRLLPAVALTVLALSVGACGSGGHPSARTGTSSGRTPVSSSSAQVGPRATQTLTPFQLAQAWFASVQPIYTSIQQDTEVIKTAAAKQDLNSIHSACQALQQDNQKARLAPAPPDRLMIAAVGSATDAYAQAAHACLSGDYATTATEIDQGAYYLSRANDIMNAMN